MASKQKWKERGYHVQDDTDVAHKDVNMFLIQTSFHHRHFVVHTQSHIMSEGWVNITTCNLIQN